MTRALHTTNTTHNRRPRHLRTHDGALIQLATRQTLMPPIKYRAPQSNDCKADPALSLIALAQRSCQTGPKASPPPKSP